MLTSLPPFFYSIQHVNNSLFLTSLNTLVIHHKYFEQIAHKHSECEYTHTPKYLTYHFFSIFYPIYNQLYFMHYTTYVAIQSNAHEYREQTCQVFPLHHSLSYTLS